MSALEWSYLITLNYPIKISSSLLYQNFTAAHHFKFQYFNHYFAQIQIKTFSSKPFLDFSISYQIVHLLSHSTFFLLLLLGLTINKSNCQLNLKFNFKLEPNYFIFYEDSNRQRSLMILLISQLLYACLKCVSRHKKF